MIRSEAMVRTLARLAVFLLALLPVLLYLTVVVLDAKGRASSGSMMQAHRINDFITLNPESWRFLNERLSDQIEPIRIPHARTVVRDLEGRDLLQAGDDCRIFCIQSTAPLRDFGNQVGELVVTVDLDHQMVWIFVVMAASWLVGFLAVHLLNLHILGPLVMTRKDNRDLRMYDPLTRLHNRSHVIERLGQLLQQMPEQAEFGALLMLDVDRFNELNDTRGHGAGDDLLVEMANRLVANARHDDLIGRVGGDEFVVVARLGSDLREAALHAEKMADSIRYKLAQPYVFSKSGQISHVTVSIGVALYSSAGVSAGELVKQAEIALFEAKRLGRNSVRFFDEKIQHALESRTSLEVALRDGLDRDEFELYYQPQGDEFGRITGAEALVRWFPADKAPVPPGEFLHVAEESGLILPLGALVLRKACEQLKAWEGSTWSDMPVSVNVAARQFEQVDFCEQVQSTLQLTGANPRLLKLEITESMVINNFEKVVERMQKLVSLGISFSLDDFGTGYSSLYVLKRLPLRQLKIDQSFVREVATNPNDYAIVKAIIALGRSLGLDVIAEGVETDEQRDFLRSFGCSYYQGYLIGKPEPASEWAS